MLSQHSKASRKKRVSGRPELVRADVESLRVKALHGVEIVLLATGLAFVVMYTSMRIHSLTMYRAGLWSFAALKSSSPAAKGAAKDRATIDFSLWSGNRVRAYTEALAARLGAPLAVLSIPRLALTVPVFDGTDKLTLNRGAGRIRGTARPGDRGNIGIAGHRDGFFRSLKDIRAGDQIELALLDRKLTYAVDNIVVVSPSDVSILRTRPQPSLTLVTCYPFYFIGDAPRRYIVQASLVDSNQATVSESHPGFSKLNKEKTRQ